MNLYSIQSLLISKQFHYHEVPEISSTPFEYKRPRPNNETRNEKLIPEQWISEIITRAISFTKLHMYSLVKFLSLFSSIS